MGFVAQCRFRSIFSPGSPLQKLSILKSRICILNPANQSWFIYFSPHLCVGFLFLILYPGPPPRPPPPAPPPSHNLSPTTLSHTTCYPQLCQTQLVTHNLSPTTLSHTTCRPQLSHTQLVTHNFVTHNLSHNNLSPTTLSHTTCHPQLCTHNLSHTHNLSPTTLSHTQLFITHTTCHVAGVALGDGHVTHNFVTHNLSPTTLSHTTCHTQLVTHNFVTHNSLSHTTCHVAGVALGDDHLRFAWQG